MVKSALLHPRHNGLLAAPSSPSSAAITDSQSHNDSGNNKKKYSVCWAELFCRYGRQTNSFFFFSRQNSKAAAKPERPAAVSCFSPSFSPFSFFLIFFYFYQLRVWLRPSSGATSPWRLKPERLMGSQSAQPSRRCLPSTNGSSRHTLTQTRLIQIQQSYSRDRSCLPIHPTLWILCCRVPPFPAACFTTSFRTWRPSLLLLFRGSEWTLTLINPNLDGCRGNGGRLKMSAVKLRMEGIN